MQATRPTLETHLSLMKPIEINLSFSTTWMQDKDVDEYQSAYEGPGCYPPNLLLSAGPSSCSPWHKALWTPTILSLSQETLELQWHRKQILLSGPTSF